jgi:hypothetical protein
MSDSDLEKARTELHYWLEIIDDLSKNNNDLEKINDLTTPLLTNITILMALALGNPALLDVIDSLNETGEATQKLVLAMLTRSERTLELIVGRIKMLKREIGINGDDLDS